MPENEQLNVLPIEPQGALYGDEPTEGITTAEQATTSPVEQTEADPTPATTPTGALNAKQEIVEIALDDIIPNPNQPRKQFDETALQGLASSIRANGLLQPIIVTAKGEDGKHVIIAGERRWRATRMIKGKKFIEAIVRPVAADDIYTLSATENLARLDMTPYEEAMVYKRFEDAGKNHGQIATLFGKSRPVIANMLGLLDLPDYVVNELGKPDAKLTMGHARALKALKDNPEGVKVLFDRIQSEGVSVRFVEEQAKEFKNKVKAGATAEQAAQAAADAPKTQPGTHAGGAIPQPGEQNPNAPTPAATTAGDAAPPKVELPEAIVKAQKEARNKLNASVVTAPKGSEFTLTITAFGAKDLARIFKALGVTQETADAVAALQK